MQLYMLNLYKASTYSRQGFPNETQIRAAGDSHRRAAMHEPVPQCGEDGDIDG